MTVPEPAPMVKRICPGAGQPVVRLSHLNLNGCPECQCAWDIGFTPMRTVPQHDAGFTCPVCKRTSYHPEDVAEGYCGHCHKFTGERTAT